MTDKGAEWFAEEFYRNVFSGHSIGESLLRTRRGVVAASGDLLTALSYVLFGDGDFTIGHNEPATTMGSTQFSNQGTVARSGTGIGAVYGGQKLQEAKINQR